MSYSVTGVTGSKSHLLQVFGTKVFKSLAKERTNMKIVKHFTLVLSLLVFHQGFAQITVTSSDMPNVGDTMKISRIDPPAGFDPTVTGTGYTWDFSSFSYSEQEDEIHLTPLQTSALYGLNFSTGYNAATYGVTSPGQELFSGTITIDERYDFYRSDVDAFKLTGYGAEINGVPTPVKYDSIDHVLFFPLDFGDKDTSWVDFEVSTPLGDYSSRGQRFSEVIGHGTITTPYGGPYNCLHVKSRLDLKDTLDIGIIQYPLAHHVTEYRWIANGEGIPLLYTVIDTLVYDASVNHTGIYYKDIERPASAFSSDVDSTCMGGTVVFTDESTGLVTSWTWDFGTDANPPTATGQGPHNVTYSSDGFKDVSLIVSSVDGTNSHTENNMIEIGGCTSIEEFDLLNQVTVHPNPASNNIALSYPQDLRLINVQLLDMQGRVVADFGNPRSGEAMELSVAETGNYFVKITTEDQVVAKMISVAK